MIVLDGSEPIIPGRSVNTEVMAEKVQSQPFKPIQRFEGDA
jgi:hypothetical protein